MNCAHGKYQVNDNWVESMLHCHPRCFQSQGETPYF